MLDLQVQDVIIYVLDFNNGLCICWSNVQFGFENKQSDLQSTITFPIAYQSWSIVPCCAFEVNGIIQFDVRPTLTGFTCTYIARPGFVTGYISIGV